MTLQELYEKIEGNYSSITERLRTEERIRKFVLLFLKDTSSQDLIQALQQGDTGEAFRAAHTLKGICMNLSFDALYQISNEMTESLRNGDIQTASEYLSDFISCYEKHVQAISAYAEH